MRKFFNRFIQKSLSNDNVLRFFVNGHEQVVEQPNLHVTLARYLREEGFTSVKIGCEEGGCGACTVIQQVEKNGKVNTVSVNACLTSICSLEGTHIITVEGLEESELMKTIQKKFVEKNASQCGYCTPGFEMAIYQFLTHNQDLEIEEAEKKIDHSLGGNLCRCSGYRQFIDVVQETLELDMKEAVAELFPQQLKGKGVPSKVFTGSDGTVFYHLNSVEDLAKAKGEIKSAKILNGGSELVLGISCFGEKHDALLFTQKIKEMDFIKEEDGMLKIGSSTTIQDIRDYCDERINENGLFPEIVYIFDHFAGIHVRNVASIGGNICNASPTSDSNPIWIATNTKFIIMNSKQETREVLAKDFFLGYKSIDLKPDEFLKEIHAPLMREHEYISVFKRSRRREDDISIVNAAMRVKFDNGVIEDSLFSFGGMGATTVFLNELPEFLKGKKLNEEVLGGALNTLAEELPLPEVARGGMSQFRRSLTLSFFYKFYLRLLKEEYGVDLGRKDTSYKPIQRKSTKGRTNAFDLFKEFDSMVDERKAKFDGSVKFVDDVPKMKNEKVGYLVLSSIPHGKIKSIDTSEAMKVEGVTGWIDYKDIPGKNEFGAQIMDEQLLVTDTINHVGQIIGMIVADDIVMAKRAAPLVKIEIEELESIISIDDAIEKESFYDFVPNVVKGDVAKGFSECEYVDEGEMYIGGQDHFSIENHGCHVFIDNGAYMVTSSAQDKDAIKSTLSNIMGVKPEDVVVRTERIGGGYGGKKSRAGVYVGCAAVAAKKFNSPVKLILDRSQDIKSSGGRHPFKICYKAGYNGDGKIIAIEAKMYLNAGHSTDLSYPVAERALMMFENCYNIPNINISCKSCKTNRPSNTAFRGLGGPQGIHFMESIIDRVSRKLNLHPNNVREAQMYKEEGDVTPYGMALPNCRAQACWNECKEISNYDQKVKEVEEFNKNNVHKKRGVYMTPVKMGVPFESFNYGASCSVVEIDTLTGDHSVESVDLVADLGEINPEDELGKIMGGFIQGYGYFTLEEVVFGDGAHPTVQRGIIKTTGPGYYKVPTSHDIPVDFNVHLMEPNGTVKPVDVGETPFCLGSSVYFAIKNAIFESRAENGYPEEKNIQLNPPLTCEKIRIGCYDEVVSRFATPEFEPNMSY